MRSPTFAVRFERIDDDASPRGLLDFLEAFAQVPETAAAKAHSLELMGAAPGQTLLDVGCGPGDDALRLAELVGPAGRVTGVDASAAAVTRARERAGARANVAFVVADATRLPFADDGFDGCRSDRTVQHLPEPEPALTEMVRVVRPGGRMVVSEQLSVLLVDGDPDESDAATAVLGGIWSASRRRGWSGFMLPLLLHRAGLTHLQTARDEADTGDMATIATVLDLESRSREAVAAGRLPAPAARAWLAGVEHAAGEGRAVLRMSYLHVGGMKQA